ncbi:hypothetical protein HF086_017159, partial [Spodoptera exigua]
GLCFVKCFYMILTCIPTLISSDFECAGDEVLVESSPPASPDMAARLAAPTQGGGAGGAASPTSVRELIVIPEIPDSMHLQHAMQQVNMKLAVGPQVSSTVVEVNGDSSGHSSPTTDGQHTYITVSSECEYFKSVFSSKNLLVQGAWNQQHFLVKKEDHSDQESKFFILIRFAFNT